MTTSSRLSGMMLAAFLGCSGGPRPAEMAEPDAAPCITGVLRSTGVEGLPELVLREESGGTTILVGDERDPLLRLTGAVVTACGPVAEGRRPELRVEGWTLHSVDGQEAHLGRLARTAGGWALEPRSGDPAAMALSAVPEALQALVDRTVWVAGRWAGSLFHVSSFGLMR